MFYAFGISLEPGRTNCITAEVELQALDGTYAADEFRRRMGAS